MAYKNKEEGRIANKRWRDANREHCRLYAEKKNHKKRTEQSEKYLWERAKARSKRDGLEFTIDIEDIVIPTHCPVLGIPLFFDGKQGHNTPTIDRIDSQLGYIKYNVAIISNRANRLKDNGTALEHELIALWMNKQ